MVTLSCFFVAGGGLGDGDFMTESPSARLSVGFCFCNRDFPTASEPVRFSFSGERKTGKKKELQGVPPRPPLKVATPQPHGESVGRIQYRPHNADRSKRGLLNILPRTIPSLASPPRAAKQGRGIELVPGGNQDPRLPEPQRDSCQRQLTDEVQVPLAEPFSNEKVTLCFVTRYRATPHHRLRAELSLKGKPDLAQFSTGQTGDDK